MPNSNGRKGSAWEKDLRDYFMEKLGRLVRRPRQEGREDIGDIHIPFTVVQAKNYGTIAEAFNVGLAGAEVQAKRAGEPFGVVAVKRRQKGTAQGYIGMSVKTFRRYITRLVRAEDLLATHAPDHYRSHIEQTKDD